MDLREYQTKAVSTAFYNHMKKFKMIYPALGLVGECGEVVEKIKKLIRDDDGEMTQERKDAIGKELGDVMWYVANICDDISVDLHSIYRARKSDNQTIQYPELVLRMSRYAMSVASSLEEWHYVYNCKSEGIISFPSLTRNLSQIILCVEELANRCDLKLEDVCNGNIEKLLNRKVRGTLKGSGDNR